MQTNKSYIVEFTGLAGAGKSYVRNLLLQQLEKDKIVFLKAVPGTRKKLEYLKYYKLFLWSLYLLVVARLKSISTFRGKYEKWIRLQILYSRVRKQGGILIVDEGLVHMFRGIRRDSKRSNFQLNVVNRKVIEHLHFPDMVVIVHAEPVDLKKRLETRNGAVSYEVKKAAKKLELTRKDIYYLKEIKGTGVYNYNNSSNTANRCSAQLNELCSIIEAGMTGEC